MPAPARAKATLKRLPDREREALGAVRKMNRIATVLIERDAVAEAKNAQRRSQPLHCNTGRLLQRMIAEFVVYGGRQVGADKLRPVGGEYVAHVEEQAATSAGLPLLRQRHDQLGT